MFEDQVTTDVYLSSIFYAICTVSVMVVVVGIAFIDAGLARTRNAVDSVVQKLLSGVACASGFLFFGFAIWHWQFNQAFGVKNSFLQSIKDWWLGGAFTNELPQAIDPEVLPFADVSQTFVGFFLAFGFLYGAFFHSVAQERMKPAALYLMSFVLGLVVWPFTAYLLWGSTSPLTNRGVHDFVGAFSVYIWAGGIALALAWKLGPRLDAFADDPGADGPEPGNLPMLAVGCLLFLTGLPLLVVGCGYIFPGVGFFDISMASGGFGRSILNVFVSFLGGGVIGGVLAYRHRNVLWALFGPIAGYISCVSVFAIAQPWKVLLISLGGPVVCHLTYRLVQRLRIDEGKVIPLALGPGIYGAIVGGFATWGTKTGGYLGLEGEFGFQHAEVTPTWQLVGVIVALGMSIVPTLIILTVLEKTIGIRVSERVERAGYDAEYWGPLGIGAAGTVLDDSSEGEPESPGVKA